MSLPSPMSSKISINLAKYIDKAMNGRTTIID